MLLSVKNKNYSKMKFRRNQPTNEPIFTVSYTDEELAQRNPTSSRHSYSVSTGREYNLPDFMSDDSLVSSSLKEIEEKIRLKAEKKREKRKKTALRVGAATITASLLAGGALKLTSGENEETITPSTTTEQPISRSEPTETTTQTEILETTSSIEDHSELTTTTEAEPILQEKLIDAKPITVSISEQEAVNFPNYFESNTRNPEEWWLDECNSQNVELPITPQYEKAKIGAHTEFAIPTEDLESLFTQIDSMHDKGQIENTIATYIKNRLGINLEFNEGAMSKSYDFGVGDQNLTLEKYVDALKNHLRGLANIPKELVMGSGVFELQLFENNIGDWGSDAAIGEYFPTFGDDGGFIRLESFKPNLEVSVIIHEMAHAIHDKACESPTSDGVLKYVWTSAINSLKENPRYLELSEKYERYRTDPEAITWEEWHEYHLLLKVQGLPSEYSKSAEFELFAEIFADLALNGYTNTPEEGINNPTRQMLYEAVIERLQVVAPNTDIGAWLQFTSMYSTKGLRPDVINPVQAVEDGHSPLDKGVISDPRLFYDRAETNNALFGYPVVALEYQGRTEVIYGYFDPIDEGMYMLIAGDINSPALSQIKSAIEQYAHNQNLSIQIGVHDGSSGIYLCEQ